MIYTPIYKNIINSELINKVKVIIDNIAMILNYKKLHMREHSINIVEHVNEAETIIDAISVWLGEDSHDKDVYDGIVELAEDYYFSEEVTEYYTDKLNEMTGDDKESYLFKIEYKNYTQSKDIYLLLKGTDVQKEVNSDTI